MPRRWTSVVPGTYASTFEGRPVEAIRDPGFGVWYLYWADATGEDSIIDGPTLASIKDWVEARDPA